VFGFFQTFLSGVFLRVFGRLVYALCLHAPQAKNVKRVQFSWNLSKRWTYFFDEIATSPSAPRNDVIARAIALAILTIAPSLHAQSDCHDLMAALNISESNAQLTARLAEFYQTAVLTSSDPEHIRRHMKSLFEEKRDELAKQIPVSPKTLQTAIEGLVIKHAASSQSVKPPEKTPAYIATGKWIPMTELPNVSFVKNTVISADGNRIVSNTKAGTAELWETSGRHLFSTGDTAYIDTIATNHNGSLFVTNYGEKGSGALWNGSGLVTRLEGHEQAVTVASFDPLGQRIVTGSEDGTARIWDLTGAPLATLEGHKGQLLQIEFSTDGEIFFTRSTGGTLKLWDRNGNLIQSVEKENNRLQSAAISPNGKWLATGYNDGTRGDGAVYLWDVEALKKTGKEPLATREWYAKGVSTVKFISEGKILTSEDNTATVWDLTGKALHTLTGHTSKVVTTDANPEGNRIVTGSWDKTARIWEGATSISTLRPGGLDVINFVKFLPGGKRIATTSAKKITLWEQEEVLVEDITKDLKEGGAR
jgi:WD40 repeat protein